MHLLHAVQPSVERSRDAGVPMVGGLIEEQKT
jgi:hypothetical protein